VKENDMLLTIYQRTLYTAATVLIIAAYLQCLFPAAIGSI
jgi:hypothetical protein